MFTASISQKAADVVFDDDATVVCLSCGSLLNFPTSLGSVSIQECASFFGQQVLHDSMPYRVSLKESGLERHGSCILGVVQGGRCSSNKKCKCDKGDIKRACKADGGAEL